MNWEIDVADDLYELQHPEDGNPFFAAAFYVRATDGNGRRFIHAHVFNSAHVTRTGIASYRDEALADAERLAAAIKVAQQAGAWTTPVGKPMWREGQPAYGSLTYELERREEDLIAFEA